jgi:hypothetical protein
MCSSFSSRWRVVTKRRPRPSRINSSALINRSAATVFSAESDFTPAERAITASSVSTGSLSIRTHRPVSGLMMGVMATSR